MTMSIVELSIDRFLTEDLTYGVRVKVMRAVGIPAELFLHRTDTSAYVCVATPTDLLTRPRTQSEAQQAFKEFYLSDTVVYTHKHKRVAEDFDVDMRKTLDRAVADWDKDDHKAWTRTDLVVLNTG